MGLGNRVGLMRGFFRDDEGLKRVQSLGFWVQGLKVRIMDAGFRFQGLGEMVLSTWFRIQGLGLGFRVYG